ncbi:NSUN7 methyltransferase, partial [Polypterus senegalus]
MDLLSPNVSIASFEEMSISEKADCKEKLSWSDGQSCGYPDCIYFAAAGIFQNIHVEKPLDRKLVSYGTVRKEPMMEIKDETSKHLSFELAFSALKYVQVMVATHSDGGTLRLSPRMQKRDPTILHMLSRAHHRTGCQERRLL